MSYTNVNFGTSLLQGKEKSSKSKKKVNAQRELFGSENVDEEDVELMQVISITNK